MKYVIFLLSLTLLSFCANAQGPKASMPKPDSVKRSTDTHMRIRLSPITITGIALASTAPALGIGGLIVLISENRKTYSPGQKETHNGEIILGVAGGMAVAGITMSIVGGIRDHKRAHRTSVSLIMPKNNEIGIAYNFPIHK